MADIRTFIAVDIPKEVKMDIDRLIAGFRGEGKSIRWVRAANLHLTLRFLGDIPSEAVPDLGKALRESVDGLNPFEITLSGLGGFPNLRRPRVIWIGVGDGTEMLKSLAARVENACIESGFGKGDKPFSSHLTIGRVKFPKGLESLMSRIENSDYQSSKIEVKEIFIVKSDLSPAGPKYTNLETVSL